MHTVTARWKDSNSIQLCTATSSMSSIEYGVQIMVPAYEGDPGDAKLVKKEKWFETPAKMYDAADDRAPANKPEFSDPSASDIT